LEGVSPFLLSRLVDASVDGIFAFDRELRLIAWNRAMQSITGLRLDDVLGKSVLEVFPFLHEGHEGSFLEALAIVLTVVLVATIRQRTANSAPIKDSTLIVIRPSTTP